MEILTLLKANMLKKKGSYISIIILVLLITAMMLSILSVKKNYTDSINDSFEATTGDVVAMIREENLTDELLNKVKSHELVDSVITHKSVTTSYAIYNGTKDNNSYFLRELTDNIKVINDKCNGYVEDVKINPGEIYLPYGLKSKVSCKIGETIEIVFTNEIKKSFTIKGFIEEPNQGSSTIGWKQVFVNKADIDELYQKLDIEEYYFIYYILEIYKDNDCELSDSKFQRQLNLDTGIISLSVGSMNNDQSLNYSTMIPNIVINVVTGFSVLLFLIVMIVISHNISTEIEMDYRVLGILKANGFTKGKIRLLFFLQYLIAEAIGIILGIILAFPIEAIVSNACEQTTGILAPNKISILVTLIYIAAVLFLSIIVIYLKTIKINKITPVKAIQGGYEDIYFSNRINLPISKKVLSLSLSFRQFSSSVKMYISIIIITALLVFCMISTNLVSSCLTSKETLRDMGVIESDINVVLKEGVDESKLEEIDKLVESYGCMIEKNSSGTLYASVNGENLLCEVYKFTENLPGMLEGRAPKYDNEISLTKFVADELDLKVGDEATVTFADESNTYIITGIHQSGSDGGYVFTMNFDGAIRNGATVNVRSRYYVLNDRSRIEEIVDKIEELHSNNVIVSYNKTGEAYTYAAYKSIVDILKIIIYSFSAIFTLVVIKMICTKTFYQEKTAIGIYKSLGFSNRKLKLQFSLRFLAVGFIATIIGVIISLLFSDNLLNLIFSLFGICKVSLKYTASSILLPFIIVLIGLFVFAYLSSNKIKKVDVRGLISE